MNAADAPRATVATREGCAALAGETMPTSTRTRPPLAQ